MSPPPTRSVAGEKPGILLDPAPLRARYDAEIRYVDGAVGRVIDELRSRDLWDDVIFAVTADHGESLGEHDLFFQHGWNLYQDSLVVPLIVRAPGLPAAKRILSIVSLIDVMPTLLGLAHLEPADSEIEGHDLAGVIRGGSPERPVYSQSFYGNRLSSIQAGKWKFIHTPGPPSESKDTRRSDMWIEYWPKESNQELYNLAEDPGELVNLMNLEDQLPETQQLRRMLSLWLKDQKGRADQLLREMETASSKKVIRKMKRDIRLEEQLEALGYF